MVAVRRVTLAAGALVFLLGTDERIAVAQLPDVVAFYVLFMRELGG
jgi:hypothetical protein